MERSTEDGHVAWDRLQRDLGLALNADVGFDETLRLCLETALRGSGMDAGGIYLTDPGTGDFELRVHTGLSPTFIGQVQRLPREQPVAVRILDGEPVYFEDYQSFVDPDDPQAQEGLHAAAVLPLNKDGDVIGSLHVASHSRRDISERDRTGLQAVAYQVTLAVSRKRAEDALRESEDRHRRVSELTSDYAYCFRVEPEGGIACEWVTGALERITGYTRQELEERGGWESLILPEDLPVAHGQLAELLAGESSVVEYRILAKDGRIRWMRDYARPEVVGERVERLYGAVQDISEFRHLEEQLNQLRKMEAIGQLAGGVAHDFNNMLAPILGYADFILRKLTPGQPFRKEVEAIREAAHRAADITGQLMSFGRRQVVDRRVIDLNREVEDVLDMLGRLLGEDIEIVTELDPEPVRVKVNPAQIQQVLINLAVNARDAMPGGGRLTIATGRALRTADDAGHQPGLREGEFGRLAVEDTGGGIAPAVRPHIFEPFFTTKERHRGSGLGLTTVYGIVQQHDGAIDVSSRPGDGARFEVLVPLAEAEPETVDAEPEPEPDGGLRASVLVVEDDDLVRDYVCSMLEGRGFSVMRAEDGRAAVDRVATHPGTIDLLVTDVVMPGMNGAQVFESLRERVPGLRVLFISGHAGGTPALNEYLAAGWELLQKPFTADQLANSVAHALERESA